MLLNVFAIFIVGSNAQEEIQLPVDKKLMEAMRERIFNGTKENCAHPRALWYAGGTASGKSSFSWYYEEQMFPPKHLCGLPARIAPDDLMEMFPEARSLKHASLCYSENIHQQAAYLALRFYDEAVEKKVNIIFDSTKSHHFNRNVESIKETTKKGYHMRLVGVTSNVVFAAIGAELRGEDHNRTIPFCFLLESFVNFTRHFPDYASLIPDHEIYDGSRAIDPSKSFTLLNHSIPDLIFANGTVRNWRLFGNFLNQSTLTPTELWQQLNSTTKEYYMEVEENCPGVPVIGPCKFPTLPHKTHDDFNILSILLLVLSILLAIGLLGTLWLWGCSNITRKERLAYEQMK